MEVVSNKIVRNDAFLKINFKTPDKIKQPSIIPNIIIPPGTSFNLKSKVIKSPNDEIPNMILSLLSVVINDVILLTKDLFKSGQFYELNVITCL